MICTFALSLSLCMYVVGLCLHNKSEYTSGGFFRFEAKSMTEAREKKSANRTSSTPVPGGQLLPSVRRTKVQESNRRERTARGWTSVDPGIVSRRRRCTAWTSSSKVVLSAHVNASSSLRARHRGPRLFFFLFPSFSFVFFSPSSEPRAHFYSYSAFLFSLLCVFNCTTVHHCIQTQL